MTNEDLTAPRYAVEYPEQLWSEILPGLTLGGTDDRDVIFEGIQGWGQDHTPSITIENFDTVITMYAFARPVDWFVKEFRFGIYDHDMQDFDTDELHDLVVAAHRDWKKGKRVLVRCQAGINRSGLVMALMLIREGYAAEAAIDLMRHKRGEAVLANQHFERWLMCLDVSAWREKPALTSQTSASKTIGAKYR
jgi:protein-tyrosine phosphatase